MYLRVMFPRSDTSYQNCILNKQVAMQRYIIDEKVSMKLHVIDNKASTQRYVINKKVSMKSAHLDNEVSMKLHVNEQESFHEKDTTLIMEFPQCGMLTGKLRCCDTSLILKFPWIDIDGLDREILKLITNSKISTKWQISEVFTSVTHTLICQ